MFESGMLDEEANSQTHLILKEYLRRSIDFSQMDIDSACYQMVTLVQNPSKVYKGFYYRKQTKNQWARDDPAFCVILILFLVVASVSYGIAFGTTTPLSYLYLILRTVCIHFLLGGIILSSLCCWASNKYLRQHHAHSVEQQVEWMYTFDIHSNGFFAVFLILYVVQFFALPLVLGQSFVSLLVGNFLYSMAAASYFYITFLGYVSLPFLNRTEYFLYPVGAVAVLFVLSLILYPIGVRISAARIVLGFLFG